MKSNFRPIAFFFVALVLIHAGCNSETSTSSEWPRARNVILFLADGTGIPTLNAASIYGYGEPQKLYLQQMPHLALSDTSAADSWVTDSGAGMTAVMTGVKTNRGVISQSADAVRGEKDGEALKTLLEYAEERGLSTGVVSNSSMSDATPAACYADSNDRGKQGYIFAQILKPRFGNGIDVVIGPGRERILEETAQMGTDIAAGLKQSGYEFVDNQNALAEAAGRTDRLIALYPLYRRSFL
ncbi:MAG: alkaline phosphatase [Acidobacteriota bacterium]